MKLPAVFTVGAKTGEGFGRIMICRPEDFAERSVKAQKQLSTNAKDGELCRLISRNKAVEDMRSEAVKFVASFGKKMNPAQIGRYAMMAKQAENLHEFKIMASKIKSNKAKECINEVIHQSKAEHYRDDLWREYMLTILTLMKYSNREEKGNEQD